MGYKNLEFFQPTPKLRELLLLSAIGRRPSSTQQELADYARLVPSMVNRYIKEFIDSEYIIMTGANHRCTSYHLTNRGRERLVDLHQEYYNEKDTFNSIFAVEALVSGALIL
jgi:DNA-binding MarR family transcriptional regulator